MLLALCFNSLTVAEKRAEIEPFKTTCLVGVWNRSWPFVTFWSVLFAVSLFIERPFCKYLCPLGAGLAVPSTFRWWGLKRKAECTTCHACAAGCDSLAIDSVGRIDQRECLLCLDCRSEEHTSELQSLMRISYAVFCLKKKTTQNKNKTTENHNINTTMNHN